MTTERIRYEFDAVSNLPTVEAQLERLVQLTNQLSSSINTQTAAYQRQATEAAQATQANLNALNASSRASQDHLDGINRSASNLNGTMRDFRTIVGASFSVLELVQFGQGIVDAKSKVDLFKSALTQMTGSKREMNELYSQIVNLAVKTPFEIEDLFAVTKTLKGMGVATSELIPTLTELGNMAAIAGQDKLPLIAKAYTDVMNKGKLMKQEINQFAENGIPLYELLAESMGKTKGEVIKMAEAHTISFDMVKKAIKDASAEGGRYYNMMTLQAETLGGEVSNLKDRFFVAKAVVGDFYEKGLKGLISGLKETVVAVAGSNDAVARTEKYIGSVVMLYGTWKLAMSELLTVQNLQRVSMLANNAILSAGTLISGTYNLAMIAMMGSTDSFTAAQVRSAVAARATWAALVSNPIGAIIAVVGTLTAAYMAWDAANDEVREGLTDMEFQLKNEQETFAIRINHAMALTMGTKERASAIQSLINKYPDYMAGMDAEKLNNNQLRGILAQVNAGYETRIKLAAMAYKVEKEENNFKKLLDQQEELMSKLPQKYQIEFDGDITKLVAAVNKGDAHSRQILSDYHSWENQTRKFSASEGFDFLTNKTFKEAQIIADGMARHRAAVEDNENKINGLKAKSVVEAEIIEQARHQTVLKQVKAGSLEYRAEMERFEDNMAKLKGQSQAKEQAAEVAHGAKLKNIRLASATEIKELTLSLDEQSFANRLKFLQAAEKAEIDSVNKIKVNRKASDDEIAATKEGALAKMKAIHERYAEAERVLRQTVALEFVAGLDQMLGEEKASLDMSAKVKKEMLKEEEEGRKEKAKADKEAVADELKWSKERIAARQDEGRINAELFDIEKNSRREMIGLFMQQVEGMGGIIGELAKTGKQVFMDWESISGESVSRAEGNLEKHRTILNNMKIAYKGDNEEQRIALGEQQKLTDAARINVAETSAASAASAMAVFSAVAQVAQAIVDSINKMMQESYQAIIDSLDKAREAYRTFYDMVAQNARQHLDDDLANHTATWAEKEARLRAYFTQETELSKKRDAIDARLAMMQDEMEMNKKMSQNAGKNFEAIVEFRKLQQQREQQIIINAAQLELAQAEELRDRKIEYIDQQLEAFKAARDKEIDILRENLDKQKGLNEQFYSDKALRLLEDETYRTLLLQQGEAREVAALEAAKQRELKRANERKATAEEIAQITTAFDKLIADKHKEYEDAKADKTKATSLANQEVKAQEKAKIEELEANTANKITGIQNQLTAQEGAAANDKKRVNEEYARAKLDAERVVFEAQKAMMIAELRAQIAVLASKRNLFNRGKIDNAIGDINAAIGDINAINFGQGTIGSGAITGGTVFNGVFIATPVGVVDNPGSGAILANPNTPAMPANPTTPIRLDTREPINVAYDQDGNVMELSFNASGKTIAVFDGNGNPLSVAYADGYVPVTGQRYFVGTEYVSGEGHRDGVDTVPAWLTKGERVLTVEQNKQLMGIPNDELVKRARMFDDVLAFSRLGLVLPDGYHDKQAAGGELGGKLDEFNDKLDRVRQAIENQKTLNLNVDQAGFSLSETAQGNTTKYYSNRMTR